MKALLAKYYSNGIKPHHQLWEQHIIGKLNKIGILGILNVSIGYILFILFDFYSLTNEILFAFFVMLSTIIVTRYFNFIVAVYVFYIGDFIFYIFFNLKLGIESYSILYYFPMMIGLVQLLGRKETIKHLYTLAIIGFISIIIVTIGFLQDYTPIPIKESTMKVLFTINIISSFSSSLIVSILIMREYINQERELKKALVEKEILLAEVFHRVKNNMNVVTSLLNLKKNTSTSDEVTEALEDCRSRVFSMALVHQNIYRSGNVELPFDEYVQELVLEINNAIGNNENTKIEISIDSIYLNLTEAIPCGLIINELITNSIKHANQEFLEISVSIYEENDFIHFIVKDNGQGYPKDITGDSKKLGIELIISLAEQLNARYSFESNNGAEFKMSFEHLKER